MQNYYEILSVPENASRDRIKKAYRRLAKKYHPDRNPSKEAEEQFLNIHEAYEILYDPIQRARYDNRLKGNDSGELFEHLKKQKRRRDNLRDELRRQYREKKKKEEEENEKIAKSLLKKAVVIIVLVIVSLSSYSYYSSRSLKLELENYGTTTIAKVIGFSPALISNYKANYEFFVDGIRYRGSETLPVAISRYPLSKYGLPISEGAEFTVTYSYRNPNYSRLETGKPTANQVDVYISQVNSTCRIFYEIELARTQKTEFCICLVENVYLEFGLEGLANIYFSNVDFWENSKNNESTFNEMWGTPQFRQIENECMANLYTTEKLK